MSWRVPGSYIPVEAGAQLRAGALVGPVHGLARPARARSRRFHASGCSFQRGGHAPALSQLPVSSGISPPAAGASRCCFAPWSSSVAGDLYDVGAVAEDEVVGGAGSEVPHLIALGWSWRQKNLAGSTAGASLAGAGQRPRVAEVVALGDVVDPGGARGASAVGCHSGSCASALPSAAPTAHARRRGPARPRTAVWREPECTRTCGGHAGQHVDPLGGGVGQGRDAGVLLRRRDSGAAQDPAEQRARRSARPNA